MRNSLSAARLADATAKPAKYPNYACARAGGLVFELRRKATSARPIANPAERHIPDTKPARPDRLFRQTRGIKDLELLANLAPLEVRGSASRPPA